MHKKKSMTSSNLNQDAQTIKWLQTNARVSKALLSNTECAQNFNVLVINIHYY